MTEQESLAIEIIARHASLPKHELAAENSLEAIGIDSLKFIVFLLEIQEALGREILTVNNVGNIKTVGDVLRLVRPPQQETPS